MSRVQADVFLRNTFFKWIFTHPGEYIFSIINEFKRAILVTDEYYPESFIKRILHPVNEIVRIERSIIHFPIWFFVFLSLPLFLKLKSNELIIFTPLIIALGYLLMMSMIHMGFTRYTLPALPFLFVAMGNIFNNYPEIFSHFKENSWKDLVR